MNRIADPEKLAQLKEQANRLPLTPGVYIMKDTTGQIIYIGKAKALKNRVTQYFGAGNQHTDKVRQMVAHVDHFETVLCDSEFEALILENALIKQNQPKYNILLKDDKGYHYILITNEKWRRLTTAMQLENKGEYIGPYYSSYVVKETAEEVRRIFKLPNCSRNFDTPSKPCLNYHIGLCDAPCSGKISLETYNETVSAARDYIRRGDRTALVRDLREKMEDAAEKLDFEYAAKLRDRIAAIEKLRERQKVVMAPYKREDVFASVRIGELFCISVFSFRNSQLSDKQHFFVEGMPGAAALYSEFLPRYYALREDIPPRIVLDAATEDNALLERYFSEKSGRKVQIVLPQKGAQRDLVQMCRNNAAENLSARTERSGREMSALNELAELLGLPEPPRYIESYDISHTGGQENVAGMIVFKDGRPFKAAYRRFKIKGFSGQDDYRSMAEVLDRRLTEYEKGEDEAFATLPDLILLDGGKGQVSAVMPVLRAHNADIPLFGLVKDGHHRTRAVATDSGEIAVKPVRRVFTLVTEIQDEVHRFAISFHKKRRTKSMLSSELTEIEGLGKKRAAAVLRHFKTMKAVRAASVEELCEVKGLPRGVALKIYEQYHQKD